MHLGSGSRIWLLLDYFCSLRLDCGLWIVDHALWIRIMDCGYCIADQDQGSGSQTTHRILMKKNENNKEKVKDYD